MGPTKRQQNKSRNSNRRRINTNNRNILNEDGNHQGQGPRQGKRHRNFRNEQWNTNPSRGFHRGGNGSNMMAIATTSQKDDVLEQLRLQRRQQEPQQQAQQQTPPRTAGEYVYDAVRKAYFHRNDMPRDTTAEGGDDDWDRSDRLDFSSRHYRQQSRFLNSFPAAITSSTNYRLPGIVGNNPILRQKILEQWAGRIICSSLRFKSFAMPFSGSDTNSTNPTTFLGQNLPHWSRSFDVIREQEQHYNISSSTGTRPESLLFLCWIPNGNATAITNTMTSAAMRWDIESNQGQSYNLFMQPPRTINLIPTSDSYYNVRFLSPTSTNNCNTWNYHADSQQPSSASSPRRHATTEWYAVALESAGRSTFQENHSILNRISVMTGRTSGQHVTRKVNDIIIINNTSTRDCHATTWFIAGASPSSPTTRSGGFLWQLDEEQYTHTPTVWTVSAEALCLEAMAGVVLVGQRNGQVTGIDTRSSRDRFSTGLPQQRDGRMPPLYWGNVVAIRPVGDHCMLVQGSQGIVNYYDVRCCRSHHSYTTLHHDPDKALLWSVSTSQRCYNNRRSKKPFRSRGMVVDPIQQLYCILPMEHDEDEEPSSTADQHTTGSVLHGTSSSDTNHRSTTNISLGLFHLTTGHRMGMRRYQASQWGSTDHGPSHTSGSIRTWVDICGRTFLPERRMGSHCSDTMPTDAAAVKADSTSVGNHDEDDGNKSETYTFWFRAWNDGIDSNQSPSDFVQVCV